MDDEIIIKSADYHSEDPNFFISWIPVDSIDALILGEQVNWAGKVFSVKSKENNTVTLEDPDGKVIPGVNIRNLRRYYKRFGLDMDDSIIIYAQHDPLYLDFDMSAYPIGKDRPYSSESKQNIGKGRNVPYGKERGAGPYGGGDQPPRCLDGMLDSKDTEKIKKRIIIDKDLFEKVHSAYYKKCTGDWEIKDFWR